MSSVKLVRWRSLQFVENFAVHVVQQFNVKSAACEEEEEFAACIEFAALELLQLKLAAATLRAWKKISRTTASSCEAAGVGRMGLGLRSAGSWRLQIHGFLQQLMIMLLILAETRTDIGFLQAQEVVNLSPPLHPSDLAVLRAVKNAMADLPGGSFFTSWEFAPGIDPCQIFTGVTCISVKGYSRVNLLSLGPEEAGEPGLWGPLPPELADLPFLQQLSISPGAVSGSIPPGLGSLTYLEEFSCAQNLLTGSIPPTIGALSKLQVLQLSMNRLEGAIPAEFSSLQALEFLVLSDNLLSGNIPVLSNNTHLVHLDLRHNELVGELVSFMLPESLEFLSLSKNQLSGGIGAVGSLSKLNYLDLSFNQFSGAIPSSLFGIAGLSYLLLNRNQLSGPLPMTLPLNSDEQLVTIQEVDLSFNLLQGNIPAFLAGVQSLYLNNNLFIGTVPQEFVASLEASTLQSLYLQHNYLSSFGSLATASIPPTVAVCVQYNCQLPPPQSLCPENAGLIARPINECTKFTAGTQN